MHFDANDAANTLKSKTEARKVTITHLAVKLAATMSQLEGAASNKAYWAMREVLPIDSSDEVKLRRLWLRALDAPVDPKMVGEMLRETCGVKRNLAESLLTRLCVVARESGAISPLKKQFLRQFGRAVGLSPWKVAGVTRRTTKQTDPYAVLGIDATLSAEKIRNHYRAAVRALHPDSYAAYGASKITLTYMTDRLAQVNAAYRSIMKTREAQLAAA